MVTKKTKTIALIAVAAVGAMLLAGLLVSPPSASKDDKQTHLTDEQQQRVDDRLSHCLDTGDC